MTRAIDYGMILAAAAALVATAFAIALLFVAVL
jgi:hypothetical protein